MPERIPVPAPDPLIDEVRELRRQVSEESGNDVDRLCDELQRIESEWRTRTGRFADIPKTPPTSELFHGSARPAPDPLLDELRELRGQKPTDHDAM